MTEKYIPVTEFQNTEHETSLQWNFNLPPTIDAERLQIHLPRFQKLQRIIGIEESVVESYQGERSEYSADMSGINLDGSIVASRTTRTKKADRSKDGITDLFSKDLQREYGTIRATHSLNKSEMVDRVVAKTRSEQALTREDAWAHELDTALRASIRSIAVKNLWLYGNPVHRYYSYIYGVGVPSGTALDVIDEEAAAISIVGAIVIIKSIHLLVNSVININNFDNTLFHQLRHTIGFGAVMPDRLALASLITTRPGLITAAR